MPPADPARNFASDNVEGASPEVLAALLRANDGAAAPYGDDEWTARVEQRLRRLFERDDLAVLLVASGTAANALALAALTPPWGSVLCHRDAHVLNDECGAPAFYGDGLKLVPLPGESSRLDVAELRAAAVRDRGDVHAQAPACVTVTQVTEGGTVYPLDALDAIGAVCREQGLRLHMDGARFANALVAIGCTPAEMTWRAGVDVLSFGASKNGALAAEAVVFFDRALAETFAFRRKRAGHLFSKMRLLAAQMEAYLADGLWLRLAAHANAMAARLGAGLATLPGAALAHPVQTNQVFVDLPGPVIAGLEAAGFGFYRWGTAETTRIRLVTAFDTRAEDVDALIATARRLANR